MNKKASERPAWLAKRVPAGGEMATVTELMNNLNLHTVCQSASCPNIGECFGERTATFLILGGICSRHCRFCAVPKGKPTELDLTEPDRLAQAVGTLGLKHTVITSVTRDDLVDGGAGQFAACIKKIREKDPSVTLEVLVPDFGGDSTALNIVLEAVPEVFNHNIETVPRLYPTVRPEADYKRSLNLLKMAAQTGTSVVKSGIMVGLGENEQEVLATFNHLVEVGVKTLTIGQYLRPSLEHLPVVEYIRPEKFRWYEDRA